MLKALSKKAGTTMKYMHFKASCSYTALAEMMEANGIHTEDYQIALEMKLPWLFAKEDGSYHAGPMLQGAKWFNLWLIPNGYKLSEISLNCDNLCRYLQVHNLVMLGIHTPYGKHAVVFEEYDGRYHFFNPTHEESGESPNLILGEKELLSMVDQTIVLGELHTTEPKPQDIAPYLINSVAVIRNNCDDIKAFAETKHDPAQYLSVMNTLFRPLLLDGISMLELAGETELAHDFSILQQDFMTFLRSSRTGVMGEMVSLDRLRRLSEEYIRLIEKQL